MPRLASQASRSTVEGSAQVLQDQHQRTVRGDGLQGLGGLPQHPLGRPAERPALEVGAVARLDQRRHLDKPGRSQAGQQGQRLAVVPAQPAQRVEHRQVRLGGAPLLETLTTGHPPRQPPLDLTGERLHQRRLPDPGLTGHEHDLRPPLFGQAIQLHEPPELHLPADGHDPWRLRASGRRFGPRWRCCPGACGGSGSSFR